MIEAGADLNDGSLYLAVDAISYAERLGATTNRGNALITLERLLDAGADPNQIYTKRIARHRGLPGPDRRRCDPAVPRNHDRK